MRVLFQARRDILNSCGGDAIQFKATRDYLMQRGVDVDFDPSPTCDCSCYDIIHLFNMTRPYETSLQLANAKQQGKIVCLSTIYWNMDDLQHEISTSTGLFGWIFWVRKGLRLGRLMRGFFNKQARHSFREECLMASLSDVKASQRKLIDGVDMLLPNSRAELDLLYRDFPSAQEKLFSIVHNCISNDVFNNSSETSRDWGALHGLGSYIVCAGRLENRKNQVRLLQAMSKTDIPVVLVGSMKASRFYSSEVRRNMKPQDVLLDEVSQKELSRIYASARVHVLPSFYDTPGLSSLEAGAMGCNLVMSEIGSQREYFGEFVEYCNPYSDDDIKLALKRAWTRPWPNAELASFIVSNYTWDVAARETHEAYKLLLMT